MRKSKLKQGQKIWYWLYYADIPESRADLVSGVLGCYQSGRWDIHNEGSFKTTPYIAGVPRKILFTENEAVAERLRGHP